MIHYLLFFLISPQPFQFRSRNIAPYSFCYDIPAKKILYVDYNISSVNLIFEKLLAREREIESELNQTTNEIIGSQYFTYLDNLIKVSFQENIDNIFQKFGLLTTSGMLFRRNLNINFNVWCQPITWHWLHGGKSPINTRMLHYNMENYLNFGMTSILT